jgi:glycosyltransferase involved in cell wall biosynthesis
VPVACLLQDEDAFLDTLPEPWRGEAWAAVRERAQEIDIFLPVSRTYAAVAQRRLGLPAERVRVVYPGIDLAGYGPPPSPPGPPAIGYLAQMSPQKGLDSLVGAFLVLKARGRVADLKLRVAGGRTSAEEPFVEGLRRRLEAAGCAADVEFITQPDRQAKQEFLRKVSVLSVPETQGEAFALYVLEALASGVPAVEPRLGVFPELAALTGGLALYDPDNMEALADALEGLLLDPARARSLADRGRKVVLEQFGVERMARDIVNVFGEAAAPARKG